MFKVLDEICTPTKGSKYSTCVDLYAREDVMIGAGETVLVPLGVCIDLPHIEDYLIKTYGMELKDFMKSHYLQLMLRSSLSKELIIANGVGIIDIDYKDEIMIRLHNPITYIENDGHIDLQLYGRPDKYAPKSSVYEREYTIKKGDKIAQIMLCEHKSYLIGIDTDKERIGGFGSTGQ